MESYDHGFTDSEDVTELGTTDLVKELYVHGRRLIENEATALKAQLTREARRTGGELRDHGKAALAQARERLDHHIGALREDLREQATAAGRAAKPVAIGGVLAHAALFLLLGALTLGLGHLMPLWLAALIVGVVAGGAAYALFRSGVTQIKEAGAHAFRRFHNEKTETKRWLDSTKRTVTETVRETKSALSGIEWPKLPVSSGGAPTPTT